MGHGIAQVFAQARLPVTLTDNSAQVLGQVAQRIQANLETCFGPSPLSGDGDKVAAILERITVTASLSEAVGRADLVVEAVVEDLVTKQEVLCQVEEHCSPHAIISSTTSGYRVRDLARPLRHPERFLVTHFWNPPYLVPVVEVMPGEQSSAEAVELTCALLRKSGKIPALVKKDVAGFVGNRLQHALRREAIAIVAQGIASPRDVDLIARLSFGLRLPIMGPLETVDLGGLDLTQAIQRYLLPELDRSTEPAALINDKVARGELGAKTGKGFYDWPADRLARTIRQRDAALTEMVAWLRERGYLEGTSSDPEI
jgi:3-hydroxybutyryl-CoA dehydrogenase